MIRSLFLLAALWISSSVCHGELVLQERWPTGNNVCADTPLRLTFNEPPAIGESGKVEVCRASDGTVVDTVELGSAQYTDRFGVNGGFQLRYEPIWIEGNTVHIRLHAHSVSFGESYFVRIGGGVFKDREGHPFTGIQDGWSFQTKQALPRNPSWLVAATDGSGDFCTIQGAVDQIDPHRDRPAVIFIRKGTYHELIRIGRERTNLQLLGEDRKGTVISYSNNDKLNPGWIQRAVLGVEGDDFVLENVTVHNTTPYRGSQAEAVFINADRAKIRRCDLLSFQDTLNVSGRVYVNDCYIEGDVDYVWGYGSACFDQCELRTMHDGYVVQSRNPPERGGYVFLDCKLTAAPEAKRCRLARIETGRFPASHVAFIRCAMSPTIIPSAWEVTGSAIESLRFQEFANTDLDGRPLDLSQRDRSGRQITAEEAAALAPARFLAGNDGWDPTAKLVRVVVIGDSTVATYPADNPTRGWGQFLQDYFKDDVKVTNLAVSGRSTKTFVAEGRWKAALAERPDYVLIQFGHNDSHGPERPESTDAATSYKDYLRQYVDEARAIGAQPILVTPMVRRTFENGQLRDDLNPYASSMKEVATEKGVPLIDLHAASARLVSQLGPDGSAEHANKPGDLTHFSEKGAKAMTQLVIDGLREADRELASHLR